MIHPATQHDVRNVLYKLDEQDLLVLASYMDVFGTNAHWKGRYIEPLLDRLEGLKRLRQAIRVINSPGV